MIFFPVLLCALLVSYGKTQKIHEEMTAEEVREVFQTSHDNVPEYEVVNIKHMRHRRSGDVLLQTKSFGQDVHLYLEPTDGFLAGKNTKVYIAKSDSSAPNGIQYRIISNAMEGLGEYYQDLKNKAAVTVKTDKTGKQLVEGTIGDNLAIRPLPEKIRENQKLAKHDYDFPNLNGINEEDFETVSNLHHFIFKTPNNHLNLENNVGRDSPLSQFSPQGPGNNNSDASYSYSRSKRDLPEVVYPEVMVVVDERLYSNFSQDVRKTVSYLVSFWNGVDLRYRSIENPKVRLNIAGIILAENTLPYVESAYVSNTDQLEAGNLLESMSKYFYQETRIKFKTDYDAVLHMTGYDLSTYDKAQNVYAAHTAGLAFLGGACRISDYEKKIMGVGTFEDNGGFSGVTSGAHELAHLLGVPHDGDDTPKYVGGPGAKPCSWNEGHIMSYKTKDAKTVRFSPCSIQSMRYYFESETAECLRNTPEIGKALPRILPGKYMSLDEQCRMEMGTVACFQYDERNCVSLFCEARGLKKGELKRCVSHRPAAEGSPCGIGKFCLNGECILETASTVPGFYAPSASQQKNRKQNRGQFH